MDVQNIINLAKKYKFVLLAIVVSVLLVTGFILWRKEKLSVVDDSSHVEDKEEKMGDEEHTGNEKKCRSVEKEEGSDE